LKPPRREHCLLGRIALQHARQLADRPEVVHGGDRVVRPERVPSALGEPVPVGVEADGTRVREHAVAVVVDDSDLGQVEHQNV
jgi:hypothetical protein